MQILNKIEFYLSACVKNWTEMELFYTKYLKNIDKNLQEYSQHCKWKLCFHSKYPFIYQGNCMHTYKHTCIISLSMCALLTCVSMSNLDGISACVYICFVFKVKWKLFTKQC